MSGVFKEQKGMVSNDDWNLPISHEVHNALVDVQQGFSLGCGIKHVQFVRAATLPVADEDLLLFVASVKRHWHRSETYHGQWGKVRFFTVILKVDQAQLILHFLFPLKLPRKDQHLRCQNYRRHIRTFVSLEGQDPRRRIIDLHLGLATGDENTSAGR